VVRIDYPTQLLLALKQPIKTKKLAVIDRLGILRDAFALAESDDVPTSEALALAQSYTAETEFTIWAKMTAELNTLDDLFAFEEFALLYKTYAKNIFKPIALKMGWTKKNRKEKHTDALLRSLSLFGLGHFGDNPTIAKAQSLFQNLIKNRRKISPDLQSVVYNLTAENGGEAEHSAMVKRYKDPSIMQEEKDRIARALGRFRKAALLEKTLKFALSENVRPQDTPFVIASVTFNPFGRDLAWNFVKKNWKLIDKHYAGGGHLLPRFISPFSHFASELKAKDIEKFFKQHKALGAERTIQQVLESIRSNAAWLQRDKQKVNNWLQGNVPENK
jgi:puromycin-sensitive aminopeptidase